MKTWQMIKELTENPGKKFISKVNTDLEATANPFTDYIKIRNIKTDVDIVRLSMSVLNGEWEEVKEPVIWQEAFEAWVNGKSFTIEYQGNIYKQPKMNKLGCFGINVSNGFEERMFTEGKWYIED